MSEVFLAVAVVAALACPAHMLLHARHGQQKGGRADRSVDDLHARQAAIAAELSARGVASSTRAEWPA